MSARDSGAPSRRKVLAGLAGALAAAPAVVAVGGALPAAAEPSPLPGLMALVRAKWIEYGDTANLESEASREAAKQHPEPHPALIANGRTLNRPWIEQLYRGRRMYDDEASATAWRDRTLQVLEAHEADCRAIDARFGVPELEAKGARISDELDALQDAIMEAPARTVADWTVKVWLAVESLGLFDTPADDLCGGEAQALQIVRDMAKASGLALPGVAS
ncbi:MAG: hypothetical protein ACLQME_12595 [Alphaproteobacteria bacterium]